MILEDVAEGRLSPEEAAERLDALSGSGQPRQQPPLQTGPAQRVRVAGAFGTVSVVGDPSVAEASASGSHTARYDDQTLVIEAGDHQHARWFSPGWSFGRPGVGWGVGWGDLSKRMLPLEVRMNPDLPLAVDLTAGSLSVRDLRGPVRLEVDAGTVRLERVNGPLTVALISGSAVIGGQITRGDSRVRCEFGKVTVQLEPGSSVRVTGRSHLGKVFLPGRQTGFGAGLVEDSVVIGDGDATLDIETSAGTVTVLAAS